MPIDINERYRSKAGEFGDYNYSEILYIAHDTDGTADINAIANAALAVAPTEDDNGLPRSSVAPTEVNLGGGWWDVTVRYRRGTTGDALQPGDTSFSFDIGTATQHITQAKANVSRAPITPFTIIDFKGAIGVGQDGSVAGCDIDITLYEWEEEHVFEDSQITPGFKTTLKTLCRQVNNAAFRGYNAGEVRLRKVRGAKRSDGKWSLTFGFSQLDNATAIVVGDILPFNKKGWEYLWIYYVEKTVTAGSAKWLAPVPQQANVEQVYDVGDYSQLQIGTAA
jgi:hypothetical protein